MKESPAYSEPFKVPPFLHRNPSISISVMSAVHKAPGCIILVKIFLDPSRVDEFMPLFKPCYDAITAEPECTFFEVAISKENPGQMTFWEGWSISKEEFETVCMTYLPPIL